MRKRESKLSSAYYDIKDVGSFGGIQALAKKTKGNQKQIKEWLESQDAYTLHKQVRYRLSRRKTIVSGPSQQWQADLIDVSRLSRHNQGNKFLLTCMDVFSKKAWVVPLKNKSGISLVAAFTSIQHPLPKTLQTDKGTEFLNHTFQQWLKDHKVHFFTTENEDIKASIVERFNRTLKTKLWRYFIHHDTLTYTDILESVVDVYNHTPHRSIGIAPNDVTSANKGRVWLRLYADPMPYKEPTLHVGDTVRISKARRAFKKGYLAQWTEEIFTIVKRKSTHYYTTSHICVGRLQWRSVKRHFLSPGITKGEQDRQRVSSGENTEEDKESSLREMVGVSRQVQQLGECERSRVIFHLIVLLVFISSILLLAFLMKESKTLSFGDDYVVVEYYINSTMNTSHSV